jgi:hypothetical protein
VMWIISLSSWAPYVSTSTSMPPVYLMVCYLGMGMTLSSSAKKTTLEAVFLFLFTFVYISVCA